MEEEQVEDRALGESEMTKNLETRVSILEVESEHVKETLRDLKEKSDDTYDLIYAVKENQDKQNGILPKIMEKMESVDAYIINQTVNQTETSIKVKIIWAIVGVLGTSVLGFAFYLLKDFVSS